MVTLTEQGVTVRPATEADAPAVAAIYNPFVTATTVSFETEPLSTPAMAQRIRSIGSQWPCLVAADAAGEVLGFAWVHPWKERPAYAGTMETTVYLAQQARGRGVGSLLMRRLIELCRERGYYALIACITADNISSIEFHKRLGFTKVSHFKGVGRKFGQVLDVVDCQLDLTSPA